MASSIVTSAAQKLGELLVEEAKYLYAVSDKMKCLQTELEWMECFLEDADNREHQEKIVRKWVSEIRDIAYEAEDIIEGFLHEISHHRRNGVLNNMKWFSCCLCDAPTLHIVGSRIDELSIRISDLLPRMQTYGIRSMERLEGSKYNIATREQRRTYSHTEENPVGLDEHEKVVVNQLLTNEDAHVVGISGMGGLGKTTLARKVFTSTAIQERFQNNCARVYISKEFDTRNVFEEILIGLSAGGDDRKSKKIRELGDEKLPQEICNILKEKECLVVVDDIWYEHSWNALKPAFESKSSRSKILITTRNEGLVKHADAFGYLHRSGLLRDDDSWELLKQKAFPNGQNKVDPKVKDEMEELGREMVRHCNGLPMAIISLGVILEPRKTVEEWTIVQKNISSYLIWKMGEGGGNDKASPALELSYYDLPFYLKPCFLYLGCFPEDFEIETERLYHLWEAEGLVTEIDAGAQARGISLDDIAESYLNELVQRCMVQAVKRRPDGKIESCRLHYVMRVMCLQKCEYVNFLSTIRWGSLEVRSKKVAGSSIGSTKLRRCALYLEDNSPDKSMSTTSTPVLDEDASLRSLLVFPCGLEGCKVDKLFSKNMMMLLSLLRVLDLQGSGIKVLPRGLKKCIHLRYLSIRGTAVAEIPRFIVYLKYLETLDLRCENGGHPVKMFGDYRRLESLRNLYLPANMSMEKSGKLRLSADEMETYANFDMRECQVEDVARMSKLRIFTYKNVGDTPEGLELLLESPMAKAGRMMTTFRIRADIINQKPTVLMAMNEYLKELEVYGKIEAAVDEADVDIFPHGLTKLELYECGIGENLYSQIEQLPHLKELELTENAVKGDYMSISDGAFPMLVRLRLQNADVVEIKVGEGAFPNLKSLELWYCGYLEKEPEGLPSSCVIDDVMCYYRELEAQDSDEDDDDDDDDDDSNAEEEAASLEHDEEEARSEPDEDVACLEP